MKVGTHNACALLLLGGTACVHETFGRHQTWSYMKKPRSHWGNRGVSNAKGQPASRSGRCTERDYIIDSGSSTSTHSSPSITSSFSGMIAVLLAAIGPVMRTVLPMY